MVEMDRRQPIAGEKRRRLLELVPVQQGSVFAAQILRDPLAVDARQRQMLTGQTHVVGIRELILGGAAKRDTVFGQSHGDAWPSKSRIMISRVAADVLGAKDLNLPCGCAGQHRHRDWKWRVLCMDCSGESIEEFM